MLVLLGLLLLLLIIEIPHTGIIHLLIADDKMINISSVNLLGAY